MDLGAVVAAVLRPGAVPVVRDERVALSVRLVSSLLDGRARLDEISPDLAREVRAADGDTPATLILPPGPGPARMELAGRQFVVPAALREALLAAVNGQGDNVTPRAATLPGTTPAASELPAQLRLATQALVTPASGELAPAGAAAEHAVATSLAASGTLRAARNDDRRTSEFTKVPFDAPVFDPRAPQATAARIAARVSDSGVFFEAHVAQWARGERSEQAVRSEADGLARLAARDPAALDQRGTTQVETLQRQAIVLSGPAWSGQAMQLELGRDPRSVRDAEAHGGGVEPVFAARLTLQLPHLGAVEVRLRLAGDRIAALVQSDGSARAAQLAAALPEFGAALAARGLQPVLLQAVRAGDSP